MNVVLLNTPSGCRTMCEKRAANGPEKCRKRFSEACSECKAYTLCRCSLYSDCSCCNHRRVARSMAVDHCSHCLLLVSHLPLALSVRGGSGAIVQCKICHSVLDDRSAFCDNWYISVWLL